MAGTATNDAETLSTLLKQHQYLTKELADHDADIRQLGNRMGGVETGLSNLTGTVQAGFAEIGKQLARQEGQKPQSLTSTMGMVALGGSIVSMMSAAITFLVLALVSPDMTKLRERSEQHHSALEIIEQERREDYRELRRAEKQRLYDRIDRLSFAPTMAPGK
jgi:hypothetical protein